MHSQVDLFEPEADEKIEPADEKIKMNSRDEGESYEPGKIKAGKMLHRFGFERLSRRMICEACGGIMNECEQECIRAAV